MSLDETFLESIQPFIDKGLISDILFELKSGKEATVFACSGGARFSGGMIALKVYRPLEHRHFRNDSAYRAGRVILSSRVRRAVASQSDFGKKAAFGIWVSTEWEHLRELHAAGLDVPRPLDFEGHVIAMEYLGTHSQPAPQLRSVKLDSDEARYIWDRITWNIAEMLRLNRIHGDLSPYNVLYHDRRPWIIDLPQMVDPRMNQNARDMLSRDLENIWRYLSKSADLPDPWKLADRLWHRWREGSL